MQAVVAERQINDVSGTLTIGPGKATRAKEWAAYVTFGVGTSAGAYKVESSPDPNFAGTWKSLGDLTWAAASAIVELNFTGMHGALRIRNTTPVAGGTAILDLIGSSL